MIVQQVTPTFCGLRQHAVVIPQFMWLKTEGSLARWFWTSVKDLARAEII